MTGEKFNALRREYGRQRLEESGTPEDPLFLFQGWMEEAINAGLNEPNAMVLATVSPEGQPSARVVLLKDFSEAGFTFFTNYNSRKGRHLAQNRKAAVLFFWEALERQVRIEGEVEKLDTERSDRYFSTRPADSRISAIASPQSEVVPGRAFLEERWKETEQAFHSGHTARPGHWGGYLLRPVRFEFWQGRENRMHDRIQYRREDKGWQMDRLAP